MKNRVILTGGKGNFEDPSNKIGHHRAAPAALWFKVRHVGYGHVVGKLKRIVPVLVAIHGARAKPARIVSLHIFVDSIGLPQKLRLLPEKAAVVIQVMNVKFEAAASNFAHKAVRNLVALLGHDLEGGLEPVRNVNINGSSREITARPFFTVGGKDEAPGGPLRP